MLPGALVDDPSPSPGSAKLQELLHGLEAKLNKPATQTSHHGNNISPYTKNTDKATHVYLKLDNPQGLQGRYHGPYKINKRVGESTIEVRTGTFKNGEPRLELHSWHNAKPAVMSEDTPIAERPKLGRPSKPAIDPSVSPDAEPGTAISAPPSSSEAQNKLKPQTKALPKPVSRKTPPSIPALSTHNMTLRSR